MLSYEKHKATVIPNTMQRFHFHLSKVEVVDGLTGSIVKSLTTGEITKFPSVVNFIQYSGLTRKQVYPRLREKRQKVYSDIIFKYEDDDTEWIK